MTEAQNAILSKIAYLDMPPGVKLPVSIMDLIKHWSESGSPPKGYEQAFNAIRNDPNGLGSLKITAYDNQSQNGFAAYGFKKNGETVVAFRGSEPLTDIFQTDAANHDWLGENVPGLFLPLTFQQWAALNFMNQNSPKGVGGANSVDVTGHSLGGRLAQTVAIIHNNVNSCTSFNAPGFSDAFIIAFGIQIFMHENRINAFKSSLDTVSWFGRHVKCPINITTGGHDLDNFIEYYNDYCDYRGRASGGGGGAFGGGGGGGAFGGGGSRGSSGSGILKVTPAVLISTANAFRDSGDRVAKLTSEILTSSIQLRTIWNGEALRTYTFKLGKLNDDAQRMCGMINEHVIDLHEMAERYYVAENQNISLSNALAEEVIF